MSWSTHGEVSSSEEIANIEFGSPPNAEVRDEQTAQLAVAKEAARKLLDSGCLGKGQFNVNLSGHASPGHETSDSMTVSIGRKPTFT